MTHEIYEQCIVKKVKLVKEDNTEEDVYALSLFVGGVIKKNIYSKELTIHD